MRHDRFSLPTLSNPGPAVRGVRAPLALALVAVAIHVVPHAGGVLELSRAGVLHGEIWRVLTGHFTHFSNEHLLWDVVAFVVLGAMVTERSLVRFAACVVGGAVAISAATLILRPDVAVYRGLSGLDSALFMAACVMLLRQGWRQARAGLVIVALLAMAGFSAKTLFELVTGRVIFVQDLGAGVAPLALAHVVGGVCGLAAGVWPLSFPWPHRHTSPLAQSRLRESSEPVERERCRGRMTNGSRCRDDWQHSPGGARGAHS